jgi:type VI protein secretion system component Hcp
MIFLKLVHEGEAVPGDATAAGYEGQIVVDSLSWTMETQLDLDGEQRNLRGVSHSPKSVTLEKFVDSASATLYQRMFSWGEKDDKRVPMFDLATIFVVDPSYDEQIRRPEAMFTILLEKCNIDSISTSASESGRASKLTERLEMSFVEGRIAYRPPHPEQAGRRLPPKSFVIPRATAKKR